MFKRRSVPPNQLPPTVNEIVNKGRRKWKFFFWGLAFLIVGTTGWIAISGLVAFKNISAKNSGDQSSFFKFNGDIPIEQLKREGDSRINIVSLGADAAAGLTDSIQIISIDPINKTMAMLSVPRDLYVTNPQGRKTKINEVYNDGVRACSAAKATCDPKVDAGGEAVKKTLETTLDVPVHYFARVDFDGVKRLVDTLGGISVYVDKPINDPKFPNRTNTGYEPFSIGAGLQKMTGDVALKYARSRQTTSDFDRARRQQQVINAIREKALSLNILANPKKVTDIISTIGTHFKTDLQSNEILELLKLVQAVDTTKNVSKVLDNGADGPLKSSVNGSGQYILIPKLGENNWTDVRDYAQSVFPEPYVIKEAATIAIVDASGKNLGESLKTKLSRYGYKVTSVTTAAAVKSSTSFVYKSDKPYTLALLKKRLGVSPSKAKDGESTTDITLTLGSSFVIK